MSRFKHRVGSNTESVVNELVQTLSQWLFSRFKHRVGGSNIDDPSRQVGGQWVGSNVESLVIFKEVGNISWRW